MVEAREQMRRRAATLPTPTGHRRLGSSGSPPDPAAIVAVDSRRLRFAHPTSRRGSELRILLVSDYYPPFIGGAQIQTQLLARRLSGNGHSVEVVSVWQDDFPAFEDDAGIGVHRLRQLRTLPGLARSRFQHHQPPFPDPVTIVGLRRLVKRFKPDIVHSYGWISYSAAAALIGIDVPLLITVRDYGYSCANRTLMRDGQECSGPGLAKCLGCAGRHYGQPKGWLAALGVLASRPLLRRKVRGIHCVSTYVRDIVRRDFLDERNEPTTSGRVIHEVIGSIAVKVPYDPSPANEEPERVGVLSRLPQEPFMLFVGALRKVKGIEQLLAAYTRLDHPPPLVLIGTIEPDSPSEFPPGVHILTDVPHEGVLAAAASRDCLFGVMPSLLPEPFGTVVCEVMSRGKPVIGTQPGGHTDMIVNEESGLLVPRGDVEALAGAMRRLIADPDLRGRLGRAAAVRSALFTADVAIPRLERLYGDVIGGQTVLPAEA
jgi:glycosyltransferase involved in cell wall biosynthesis